MLNDCEISIIIPVFNEQGNILQLYKRLKKVLELELNVTHEIIFVDDGSNDDSWKIINGLYSQDKTVKGFKFSKNFGHQYALKAGLDYSNGKAVITLDADLQHPPELVKDLYNHWKEGYEIVYTIRKNTEGETFFKNLSSYIFYKFIYFVSDVHIQKGTADFRLVDKSVVDVLRKINENQIFLRGIIGWIGFNSTSIEYTADERFSGKTKYSIFKMIKFAIDGIMSFSIKPLRITSLLGFFFTFVSFVYIIYAIYAKVFLNIAITGWTSTLISILFLGGIQLLSLGIIGEYIGKLYIESKKRPGYIIHKRLD